MAIQYKLSFPNPQDHYVIVEMSVPVNSKDDIQLFMPVWTPGSYMVREFSRHIDLFRAEDVAGNLLSWEKVNKNNWRISTQGNAEIKVKYRVYANEMTVRTSHVNAEHAMLNPASIFMGVEGQTNTKHEVIILPYADWKVISTSLSATNSKWERTSVSYDELIDSPIEIGNHQVFAFTAGGLTHELALVGPSNAQVDELLKDIAKIVEAEVALFDTIHPCDRYLFVIYHTELTRGGLEHAYSSFNMIPRWNYGHRDHYLQAVSLLAHEYFHLWNVKRIRSEALGPFNYQQEVYTRQLWMIEGITSYYDDYFVYLAGISSKKEYLDIVANNINAVVNQPGDPYQSLAESSFDTWLKYYRQHENSHNNQVNYYIKGSTIATALNILILDVTNGQRSLDDVMRAFYHRYLKLPQTGMTEAEVLEIFNSIAGLSVADFFENHIFGTQPIDYAAYFTKVGLQLIDSKQPGSIHLGWTLSNKEGRWMVSKVDDGYGAYEAGITAEDEIISINGYRMTNAWERFYSTKNVGDRVEVILSRSGIIKTIQMRLTEDKRHDYKLVEIESASGKQQMLRQIWLNK